MSRSNHPMHLWLKNMLLLISGTALLALGTALFILPYRLICGGISSLAILAEAFLPRIDSETWIAILSYVLFFFGIVFLGRYFAMKTLLSTILYPAFVSLFSLFVEKGGAEGVLFSSFMGEGIAPLALASILGGAIVGAGCAIALLSGGSTGGVDILSLILCKRFPRLRHSVVVFLIDTTVIFLGIFVTRNPERSILGILSALVCAFTIDRILAVFDRK